MNLITIQGRTYEEAVKKAHLEYGDNLRFISRKIVQRTGFLGIKTGKYCELTCYLSDENSLNDSQVVSGQTDESEHILIERFVNEAKTSDPDSQPGDTGASKSPVNSADSAFVSEKVRLLCLKNGFTPEFSEEVINEVSRKILNSYYGKVSENHIESAFRNTVLSFLKLEESSLFNPPSQMVIVGPPGSGKSLNAARLCCLYNSMENVSASLSYCGSAFKPQIESVSVFKLGTPEDYKRVIETVKPRILVVDTDGNVENVERSIIAFSNMVPESDFRVYLNLPCTMKYQDMISFAEKYRYLKPSALILSFFDVSVDMGNAVSFMWKTNIPLLFVSESNSLASGIRQAVPSYFEGKLKGLS